MSAFLYGVALQWKLDIRSKSLLITCYAVPLLFFAVMGGIFTSINPDAKATLIQSMTVLGVSTGALLGLPPSLAEIYGSDIKKVYKANGVPLYVGSLSIYISVSLSVGSVLGLAVKNQAKLTMLSQMIFLPSIMLSGIMFPVDLLPRIFELAGKLFPASWGYTLLTGDVFYYGNLWPLAAIFAAAFILCSLLLKRLQSE